MEIICNHQESTLSIIINLISIFVPIILTIILIVQNKIYNKRNEELQKEIHNRDIRLRKHDDILNIYSYFYEFNDFLISNNLLFEIKAGNINYVMPLCNNLAQMRLAFCKKLNLAELLFKRNDNELYLVIKKCIDLNIEIIDKFLSYIRGNLLQVSTDAWNKIIILNPNIQIYNYYMLQSYPDNFNDFLKMCETENTKELEALLDKQKELNEYEKFDVYFEKYLGMEELK